MSMFISLIAIIWLFESKDVDNATGKYVSTCTRMTRRCEFTYTHYFATVCGSVKFSQILLDHVTDGTCFFSVFLHANLLL